MSGEQASRPYTTDASLIDQTLKGDSEAFGELVRKHQGRLFNSIIHNARCREDAEDIVQDAFVHAYTQLGYFRHESAFYTWLYRIAMNLVISRHRQQQPSVSMDGWRDISDSEPQDNRGDPGERCEWEESLSQIQQALDSLPDQHRTILVLRGIDGFGYETISQMLELNLGTVRSRLHRARRKFRRQLAALN
ncbi:MAG: sigma-70 family RNA polymerase sigma factor [Planctomycetes bacterium]|nr:sigma-70 family RNA polymerase sigma factor [Planctomycetota bacterium]MBL7040651.1 sigma-70 family RNA polymerase sigma factor [Pirellulaceae bacterium]